MARAVSDVVVGNWMTIYVAVLAGIKAYGAAFGRSFGGGVVVILSTAVMCLILIGAVAWDVSRKSTHAAASREKHRVHVREVCTGGICWHGVAVRSAASEVRVRLPNQFYGFNS